MNYYIFVLGYDLLHDMLNGVECDVAHNFCTTVYENFLDSEYNNPNKSEYTCLSKYINENFEAIKKRFEEELK